MAKQQVKRASRDFGHGGAPLPSVVAAGIQDQLAPFRPVAWKIDWISQTGETFAISNNSPQLPELDGLVSGPLDYSSDSSSHAAKTRQYSQPTPPPSEAGSFSAVPSRKRAASVSEGKNDKRVRTQPVAGRLRADDATDSEDEDDDEFRSVAKRVVDVRVNDLRPVYVTLFKMLQQRGCKKIAQAWIKKGEPRKQGVHPYNGGANAMKYPDYDPKNPGKHTAPPYWPHQNDWANPATTGARHKEPDHSKVYERLNVLCHLLRLGTKCEGYSFDVDLLEESTKDIMVMHQGHFRDDAPAILADIYRARRAEQQWECGQIPSRNDRPRSLASTRKKPSVSKRASVSSISKQDLPKIHIPMTVTPEIKSEPTSACPNLFHDKTNFPMTPPNEMHFRPVKFEHSASNSFSEILPSNLSSMAGIENGFTPMTPGDVSPRSSFPNSFNFPPTGPVAVADAPFTSFDNSTPAWTGDGTWYPNLCENPWGVADHDFELHMPIQNPVPREASPMYSEWAVPGADFIAA